MAYVQKQTLRTEIEMSEKGTVKMSDLQEAFTDLDNDDLDDSSEVHFAHRTDGEKSIW